MKPAPLRRLCDPGPVRDWIGWHDAYDDPASSLARRLEVVKRRLDQALDSLTTTRPRLLSLCAGDGRDVIGVLARRVPSLAVTALLIDSDPKLTARATAAAGGAGLGSVQVRCADAGDIASFADVVPVDVLMLCGIFGNIDHSAVKNVIQATPGLLNVGGYVIWTRGGSEPDRRPQVRSWFESAGLEEVAFDGTPQPYGVGVNRKTPRSALSPTRQITDRLFTFA